MCDSIGVSGWKCRGGFGIFGKASDRAVNEPQPLVFVPAADHQQGERIQCTYIEVSQVSHTYAMILSKPSWIWGAEIEVNEFGLCVGNESVFSKEMNVEEKALVGMDIVRLVLERAATASEAVDVLGQIMEEYGQGGNASFDGIFHYDNAYLIMDETECWHVETAGKHFWAAKKVDGAYSISNYLSIDRPDKMHRDLIKNAEEKGYLTEQPFNFSKAYVDWTSPVNQSGMLRRCCSFHQANKPGNDFTVKDMIEILRSHYTTDPWTRGGSCVCMHAEAPKSPEDIVCQTCGAMIAVCRGKDTAMWGTGMGVTCMAPFQPFWFDAFSRKQVFEYKDMEAAIEEWLKREQINRAVIDGRIPEEIYKKELYALENEWLKKVDDVGKAREDRQKLCDAIEEEAEAFLEKWIVYAEKQPSDPAGDEKLQEFWREKNRELGKDRRMAL